MPLQRGEAQVACESQCNIQSPLSKKCRYIRGFCRYIQGVLLRKKSSHFSRVVVSSDVVMSRDHCNTNDACFVSVRSILIAYFKSWLHKVVISLGLITAKYEIRLIMLNQ